MSKLTSDMKVLITFIIVTLVFLIYLVFTFAYNRYTVWQSNHIENQLQEIQDNFISLDYDEAVAVEYHFHSVITITSQLDSKTYTKDFDSLKSKAGDYSCYSYNETGESYKNIYDYDSDTYYFEISKDNKLYYGFQANGVLDMQGTTPFSDNSFVKPQRFNVSRISKKGDLYTIYPSDYYRVKVTYKKTPDIYWNYTINDTDLNYVYYPTPDNMAFYDAKGKGKVKIDFDFTKHKATIVTKFSNLSDDRGNIYDIDTNSTISYLDSFEKDKLQVENGIFLSSFDLPTLAVINAPVDVNADVKIPLKYNDGSDRSFILIAIQSDESGTYQLNEDVKYDVFSKNGNYLGENIPITFTADSRVVLKLFPENYDSNFFDLKLKKIQ